MYYGLIIKYRKISAIKYLHGRVHRSHTSQFIYFLHVHMSCLLLLWIYRYQKNYLIVYLFI